MTIHHSDPLERQGKNEAVSRKSADRRTHGDREPRAVRAAARSRALRRCDVAPVSTRHEADAPRITPHQIVP